MVYRCDELGAKHALVRLYHDIRGDAGPFGGFVDGAALAVIRSVEDAGSTAENRRLLRQTLAHLKNIDEETVRRRRLSFKRMVAALRRHFPSNNT